MQKNKQKSNNNAVRVADLTNNPGNGSFIIRPILYPYTEFYTIPDEYKGLEISDRKYMITNWSVVKKRDFKFFYQNKTTLGTWHDQYGVQDGLPVSKSGNWPLSKLIPREHVIVKNIFYYTIVYKLKLGDKEYEAVNESDFGSDDLNPKVIGKRLLRGCDDVAFYIGPSFVATTDAALPQASGLVVR